MNMKAKIKELIIDVAILSVVVPLSPIFMMRVPREDLEEPKAYVMPLAITTCTMMVVYIWLLVAIIQGIIK
jgi:hypothetical protein